MGRAVNRRTCRNHSNYNITKIGQDTKKSPRDSIKRPSTRVKNSQGIVVRYVHEKRLMVEDLSMCQKCIWEPFYIYIYIYFPGLLSGPSGIRVGSGIETNGRFETERPPGSVGPPSGGRAAFLSPPLHSLYSTRPHGLVQAIFWHTCPDLDLGPWYCLTH